MANLLGGCLHAVAISAKRQITDEKKAISGMLFVAKGQKPVALLIYRGLGCGIGL
jgi:hypothetical protein